MVYFIIAALLFIAIGSTLAICIVVISKKNKTKSIINDLNKQESSNDNKDNEGKNYMSYGMSIGMCLGAAIGTSLSGIFGIMALSYGVCFGMVIGMAVGMSIKRK